MRLNWDLGFRHPSIAAPACTVIASKVPWCRLPTSACEHVASNHCGTLSVRSWPICESSGILEQDEGHTCRMRINIQYHKIKWYTPIIRFQSSLGKNQAIVVDSSLAQRYPAILRILERWTELASPRCQLCWSAIRWFDLSSLSSMTLLRAPNEKSCEIETKCIPSENAISSNYPLNSTTHAEILCMPAPSATDQIVCRGILSGNRSLLTRRAAKPCRTGRTQTSNRRASSLTLSLRSLRWTFSS